MSQLLTPPGGIASTVVPACGLTLSIVTAFLATLVGLDLSFRSRQAEADRSAHLWVFAASGAMGSGMWAMHFVGLSSMNYAFKPMLEIWPAFVSWALAVVVCTFPLRAIADDALRNGVACWVHGCATAAGIASMHYVGVSAMPTTPSPSFDWRWVAAALTWGSAFCSMGLYEVVKSRAIEPATRRPGRTRAIVYIGCGSAGLFVLALTAQTFHPGSVESAVDGIDADSISGAVGTVTLAFLGLMALIAHLEERAQVVAKDLSHSLRAARDEIIRVAQSDAPTGLPNRIVFQDRLNRAAIQSEATGNSLALLLVEIDDFARATRMCSPEETARTLRACAERIVAASKGHTCEIASAGGHAFWILATFQERPDATLAMRIAATVGAELRAPIVVGPTCRLTASIGIALHSDKSEVARLTNNAGIALEVAQSRGGNGYAFFEPRMDSDARAAVELLKELRFAADRGQLLLNYQPKVYAGSGKIAGVEALIRWNHPDRGMISPGIFIPIAERFGLIREIGTWVLSEAARQMGVWAHQGIRLRVAVNVSPSQLLQADFAEQVGDVLRQSGVEPELLTCEITETGAMQDSEVTMRVFKRLQALGVQLSIDDFGTGYSSLSHLRKIPLRQLKIDRSFVADIAGCSDARSIVAAIVVMAHALRLEVVAEGVETFEQRDILAELGCDEFQGFLFAKPMPASALMQLLSSPATASCDFTDAGRFGDWQTADSVRRQEVAALAISD